MNPIPIMEAIHKNISAIVGPFDGTQLVNRPVGITEGEHLTFCFTRRSMVEPQQGAKEILERESQRFKHSFIIRQCQVMIRNSMSGMYGSCIQRTGEFSSDSIIKDYLHRRLDNIGVYADEKRYYGAGIIGGVFYPSEVAIRKQFASLPKVKVEAVETKHQREYSRHQTVAFLLTCGRRRRMTAGFKADYLIKRKDDPALYAYGVHTIGLIAPYRYPFRFPPNKRGNQHKQKPTQSKWTN